jgi:membrane-associated phospholipid phosphatase
MNMNTNHRKNIISREGLPIYNNDPSNLSYSPAQYKQGVFIDSKKQGGRVENVNLVDSKSAMNATVGRNPEIHKNETLYIAAQYISNTVSVMYISVFISLIILKDKRWFYILLIVFIVNVLGTIFKVFTIRFNYDFLRRPGTCIDENMTYDFLESNFILEGIKNRVNSSDYNVMGFPSIHITRATTILALTYLFFPKYRKITGIVAPIYIVFLAWSRMYLNCHTVIQIIGGILFGVISAKIAFNICK